MQGSSALISPRLHVLDAPATRTVVGPWLRQARPAVVAALIEAILILGLVVASLGLGAEGSAVVGSPNGTSAPEIAPAPPMAPGPIAPPAPLPGPVL